MSLDIASVPSGGHSYLQLRIVNLDWVLNSHASKGLWFYVSSGIIVLILQMMKSGQGEIEWPAQATHFNTEC